METSTTTTETKAPKAPKAGNLSDGDYARFLVFVNARFTEQVIASGRRLFTTDVGSMWDEYLQSFPAEERQFHNCCECRSFINRYGGLVMLDEHGVAASPLWGPADIPEPYAPAFAALERLVLKARVTGVFLSSLDVWGHPETGVWRHYAVVPPREMVRAKTPGFTDGQVMAEKRAECGNVSRALAEFGPDVVDQAVTLLGADALYRSEKVLGQAQWLQALHVARAGAKDQRRQANLVWRAVANAPAGFCHPRSSMIGTLLEDLAAGRTFAEVSRKFREKMAADQYQRPQAAPTAGNIAQAEKLVEQLGVAPSLARRYARLDEVEPLWLPKDTAADPTGGVFGHLQPKGEPATSPLEVPASNITWEKFQRTVLPGAVKIQLFVPGHGPFAGLLTAENQDAPPILQWDRPERRNPVSWYCYTNGSPASRWGLRNCWWPVTGLTLQPSMWFGGTFEHQGAGVLFLLKDAKDTHAAGGGNCLFPESLRAELHGVRATIEAYSKTARLGGREQASANGLMLQSGSGTCQALVRVILTNDARFDYRIDRWN